MTVEDKLTEKQLNQIRKLTTNQLVCSCFGKGYFVIQEPEEYFDEEGNRNIRFKTVHLPCPHCGEKMGMKK